MSKAIASLFAALADASTRNDSANTLGESFANLSGNVDTIGKAVAAVHNEFEAFKGQATQAANLNTKAIQDLSNVVANNAKDNSTGMQQLIANIKVDQDKKAEQIAALQSYNKEWKPWDMFVALGAGLSIVTTGLGAGAALGAANTRTPRTPGT